MPLQIREPRLDPDATVVPCARCCACGGRVRGTPERGGTWWAFCERSLYGRCDNEPVEIGRRA